MALLNLDRELARAGNAPAFSNGFEGECWMDNWCNNCRRSDDEDGCVLIDVAMLGKTPYAWERINWRSLKNRYACHEFLRRPADDCCDCPDLHWHTTRPCGCVLLVAENSLTTYSEVDSICEAHQR